MTGLGQLLRLFAASIVPGGGFLLAGWSAATALTLYWIDNLVGSVAMGARIVIHRRSTGLAGHGRAHLGATYSTGSRGARTTHKFQSFLAEFLAASLGFTAAHGVFLAVLLLGLMAQQPDVESVRQGTIGIAICHALALGFDARRLAGWPFARLKQQAMQVMGRVVVVHFTIMGGMAFFAWRGTPGAFFSVFIGLKFMADLASMLPQYNPQEPPRWLVAVMNLLPLRKKGESFEAYWRRKRAQEDVEAAQDERVSGR